LILRCLRRPPARRHRSFSRRTRAGSPPSAAREHFGRPSTVGITGHRSIVAGLLGDFIGYWVDRAMHVVPALWRLHAVHHSSTKLDWPAAARVNPLESIVSKLAAIVPMFLLGFSPAITGIYGPFLGFYPIFIHCNLRWGYGKLARKGSVAALNVSQANVRASPRPRLRFAGARESHVIASPSFHRWHHSADADARDKNFSALFPFYDYLSEPPIFRAIGIRPAMGSKARQFPAASCVNWPIHFESSHSDRRISSGFCPNIRKLATQPAATAMSAVSSTAIRFGIRLK
jgi:hypothetical protein